MKTNLLIALIVATTFTGIFSSCTKENNQATQVVETKSNSATQPNAEKQNPQSASAASATPTLTYITCSKPINIYNPQAGQYTLAMPYGSSYKKFGIPGFGGLLDFQNIDYVTFEFSGLYADPANTVKLYRVRRTDGKYLTFHLYLDYSPLLQAGQNPELQYWIINNLGNNQYNLVLPKFGNTCWLARTYPDNANYRIGMVDINQATYPGSTTIFIHSASIIPPNTK